MDKDYTFYFLVANSWEILEVRQENLKNSPRFWESPEYETKQILQWVSEKTPWTVGTKLPLEFNGEYRLVKTVIPLKEKETTLEQKREERKLWDEKDKQGKIDLEKYLKDYSLERTNKAKKLLSDYENSDEEVYYRVFYNSFKMYRLREQTFQIAQEMINLVQNTDKNYTTLEELMQDFERSWFDKTLTIGLKKIIDTQFTLDKNESQRWAEDAFVLFSVYNLFFRALKFLVDFNEKLDKKTLFLFEDKRYAIDWVEAGAMEVWLPLRSLRYVDEKNKEKYKALIR